MYIKLLIVVVLAFYCSINVDGEISFNIKPMNGSFLLNCTPKFNENQFVDRLVMKKNTTVFYKVEREYEYEPFKVKIIKLPGMRSIREIGLGQVVIVGSAKGVYNCTGAVALKKKPWFEKSQTLLRSYPKEPRMARRTGAQNGVPSSFSIWPLSILISLLLLKSYW